MMRKITVVRSIAAPLLMPNIDTDIISPMKRILFHGDEIEKYGFEPLRFINGDGDKRIENPEFPLNQSKYRNAKILLCGENFGCGSSRETAPEAIAGMGILCVIGTSFGGIFFKNCFNQGVLPIKVTKETFNEIHQLSENGEEITVDLEQKIIAFPDGKKIEFEIGENQRFLLMEGLDNTGLTLRNKEKIIAFEEEDEKTRPWIYFASVSNDKEAV